MVGQVWGTVVISVANANGLECGTEDETKSKNCVGKSGDQRSESHPNDDFSRAVGYS